MAAPAIVRGRNLNEKLNIAMIGVGGRGGSNLGDVASENIVALCDVYEPAIDRAAVRHPQARRFRDFRKLFDHAREFDAVVVSTTEHTHAFATLPALQLGKHVYCEKPLTYNIWEARVIREAAAKAKVATQMGTQIHAGDNYRRVVELIQTGAIGPVHEVHVWVGRAWGRQSEEAAKRHHDIVFVTERPAEATPVPTGLDWDLWLGPAPARPFNEVYFPGPKWYRWWDFGNGTMSDLGSHWNDLPFWALKLQAPLTIEAFGPPPHPEIAPASMHATYEYGPRGDMPRGQGALVSRRREAGAVASRRNPQVGERRSVRRRQGNAAGRLRPARALAGEGIPRLRPPQAVHSQVDRPSRRVDPRLQDRRAHDLQLRVRGLAHRGQSPGQRRLPRRQEARVGRRQALRHQRPRGRAVHPPRLPQGLDLGLRTAIRQ